MSAINALGIGWAGLRVKGLLIVLSVPLARQHYPSKISAWDLNTLGYIDVKA